MSDNLLIRATLSFVFAAVVACLSEEGSLRKKANDTDLAANDYTLVYPDGKRPKTYEPRYHYPNWNNSLLILYLVLIPLYMVFAGPKLAARFVFYKSIEVFILLTGYYVFLLLFMPLLRKIFRPMGCAILWMVPNILYLSINAAFRRDHPAFVIPVSRKVFIAAGIVWICGAAAYLLYAVITHLRLRRNLIGQSHPCADPQVLEQFRLLRDVYCGDKYDYELLFCPLLQSPLSIGLFQRTTCVILPDAAYSPEDLDLIFRHELIHICRKDASVKFFLTFCSALCWFNPLMHLAMSRCSEDLELSCDQLVLQDTGEQTRERYASLILSTAAESRGFTSCLSATARSLTYRLTQILDPVKKLSAGILIGLTAFILLMSINAFAVAYDAGTLGDLSWNDAFKEGKGTISSILLRPERDPEDLKYSKERQTAMHCRDENAQAELLRYLAELPCDELTGVYDQIMDVPELTIVFHSDQGYDYLHVYERYVWANERIQNRDHSWYSVSRFFWLPQPADMDYLMTLIDDSLPVEAEVTVNDL